MSLEGRSEGVETDMAQINFLWLPLAQKDMRHNGIRQITQSQIGQFYIWACEMRVLSMRSSLTRRFPIQMLLLFDLFDKLIERKIECFGNLFHTISIVVNGINKQVVI